jgi:radical SAM superfamily enzyme YgiQ (UPF0313 family)
MNTLPAFRNIFDKLNREAGGRQFLTYYFIAAHPGCTEQDMHSLKSFVSRELKINPRQIQIFTPTPSTYSALMYWTQTDPTTGRKIFVEKNAGNKQRQKDIITRPKAVNKSRRDFNRRQGLIPESTGEKRR